MSGGSELQTVKRWRAPSAIELFGYESGPTLKVARANRHLLDFYQMMTDYLETDPFPVTLEDDADGVHQNARINIVRKVPLELGALLGDVVHNLRASLDLIACDMARQNGCTEVQIEKTYFPISKNEEMYKLGPQTAGGGRGKSGRHKIHYLSPSDKDAIDALMPYGGGNQLLYNLHELDRLDKHQIIVPVAANSASRTGPLGIEPSGLNDGTGIILPARVTQKLTDGMIYDTAPKGMLLARAHPVLVFGTGALEGEEVLPSLMVIRDEVYRVIRFLAKP